ncbi:MAG: HAD-superfamily hydrolase, subfamily variant 3 [Chloroflexi bacterium]|nr:HAD-superfamily hydrolase, subfamily variant 3 [Chloroflexota bacterium]
MTTKPTVGVIWDLDGTLADTEQAHFLAWQIVCRRFGRELSWDEFKPTFGLGNPDILHMLVSPTLAEAELQRLSEEKEAFFRAESRGGIKPMPGARQLALHLQALGIPQAIGSSAPPENIPFVLQALGLESIFAATVSRWEVPNGKPFPDIFLRAAEKLDIEPSHCLVLEDAPAGIQAAHAAGMRCIALSSTWPESALSGADYVVRDLSAACWDYATFDAFSSGTWQPK